MKTLIKFLTKEDTIIALLLALEHGILTYILRICYNPYGPIHLYILAYLSIMAFCAVQNLSFTYSENLDRITRRHIKWAAVTVFVIFLYFMLGNPILSSIVGLWLTLCKKVLFGGQNEKAMTWTEVMKFLKIA